MKLLVNWLVATLAGVALGIGVSVAERSPWPAVATFCAWLVGYSFGWLERTTGR